METNSVLRQWAPDPARGRHARHRRAKTGLFFTTHYDKTMDKLSFHQILFSLSLGPLPPVQALFFPSDTFNALSCDRMRAALII